MTHPIEAAADAVERELADLRAKLAQSAADNNGLVKLVMVTHENNEALRAKLAVAVEAIEACVASLERADTTEGVCCCGDSMEQHSDPMSCGHSPVDMGNYYASKAIEAARAALAQIKGE